MSVLTADWTEVGSTLFLDLSFLPFTSFCGQFANAYFLDFMDRLTANGSLVGPTAYFWWLRRVLLDFDSDFVLY